MTRVALIGAGFIAGNHVAAFAALPNTKLVAVCSATLEHAEKLAAPHGARAFTDAERMFAEVDFEMVDICAPTWLHAKFAVMAAKRGKHVLCEKPIALNLADVDAMMAAAKASGVKLMIAQVLRFWPEYVEIKKRLDRGELGEIQMVYANRLAQHPTWGEWFKDPAKSGGGLFDLHLHDIDILRHYFGPVEKVYAIGWKNPAGCWNHVNSSLTFKNGVKAVAEGAFQMSSGYPFTMTMRVVGTKGTLEFALSAGLNLEDLGGASARLLHFSEGRPPEIVKVEQGDGYRNEIAYFVDCVEKGVDPLLMPVAESREVFDLVLALRRSLESGETQRV